MKRTLWAKRILGADWNKTTEITLLIFLRLAALNLSEVENNIDYYTLQTVSIFLASAWISETREVRARASPPARLSPDFARPFFPCHFISLLVRWTKGWFSLAQVISPVLYFIIWQTLVHDEKLEHSDHLVPWAVWILQYGLPPNSFFETSPVHKLAKYFPNTDRTS